jgi:hypothetical protein
MNFNSKLYEQSDFSNKFKTFGSLGIVGKVRTRRGAAARGGTVVRRGGFACGGGGTVCGASPHTSSSIRKGRGAATFSSVDCCAL